MFAAAAVLALIRIVRGPSIVDRMAGSDTLLTVLICVLASEMALNGHLNTLPLLIALAMTASIGTLAVARFVSRVRRQSDER
ncbi:sodium:proton antiporter [Gulosibacter macacae]|uniref:Sodium:proton antiporter n=2 Tax=Gulosibacter macacae TaxID=2488791 RepID=A0A3P3W0S0_9MICO|nr:sodium:proton antiporter [Gulosibacter macacae]